MAEKSDLKTKQLYLQSIIPRLDDAQITKMMETLKHDEKPLPEGVGSDNAYDELMSMVGCENAKMQIKAIIAEKRLKKIAAARGRKIPRAYYHAVFCGNPGCAKSTVARLYAKILADEGITRNNNFEELSRAGIIGRFQGETACNVREHFKQNSGGVIFIDEAYALCEKNTGTASGDSYGEEAINEICYCLENNPDTVVIFAGYEDRMEEFLSLNPGLRSRIPYKIEFNDYTSEELVAISENIANEKGFTISREASDKLNGIFNTVREEKDFGNGRFARTMVEDAIRNKALHLGLMDSDEIKDYSCYSDEELFTLDESCFKSKSSQRPAKKRSIGFCCTNV